MIKANKDSKNRRLRVERAIQSASSQQTRSTYVDGFRIGLVRRTKRLREHNPCSM